MSTQIDKTVKGMWVTALHSGAHKEEALARFLSIQEKGSSEMLQAIPRSFELVLRDQEFEVALRHYLGVDLLQNMPARCPCGAVLADTEPSHLMHCPKASGKHTTRHHGMNKRVAHHARKLNLTTVLEKYHPAEPDHENKDLRKKAWIVDVLIELSRGPLALDGAVRHPCSPSFVKAACKKALTAAQSREREKDCNRNLAWAEHCGYAFEPFVVEAYGAIGKRAMAVIERIAQEASDIPPQEVKRRLILDVSLAVLRGNARVVAEAARRCHTFSAGAVGQRVDA
jgi:hypothetical protein